MSKWRNGRRTALKMLRDLSHVGSTPTFDTRFTSGIQMKQKILVILGPTASGKSSLAVDLALQFNGEIISADSRQVYAGLDIGTGKITQEEMKGVRHHLIDMADPTIPASDPRHYGVTQWKESAEEILKDIGSRGKTAIICGGTGFYIDALVDNIVLPEVPHDAELQAELATKTPEELMKMIEELDPERAAELDPRNRRRIIRSIEIAQALGSVPKASKDQSRYEVLKIGIRTGDTELKQRINDRLIARINAGMVEEVQRLHSKPPAGIGLSYERMNELGLEYRYLAEFLQGKLDREQLIEILATKIWQYARRQKTWFKKDTRIQWMTLDQRNEIFETVTQFMK